MAYSIRNFANTTIYSVNDSTANTNAVSLTLLGKSLPNYGTYFNQNFVWLMENFSSDSANPPPFAVQGQLWWDNTYKFLNVYDGSNWKTVYGNLATINANGAATVGNLTTTNGIYWSNGVAFASSIYSNANVTAYLPTYSGSLGGTLTTAAQTNITSVGTLTGLTTTGNITSGNQVIGYHTGAVGANIANTGAFTTLTTSGTIVSQGNITSAGQIIGYHTGAIGANSANTGRFTTVTATSTYFPGGNTSVDIGTSGLLFANVYGSNYYVGNVLLPLANVNPNIGSPEASFNNIYAVNFFGTSTTAKYADLAEKYLPDSNYEVGTVVMIGGSAEITQHDGSMMRAIGVISENPAYKMNADQEGGIYVALKGRVPVKVSGPVEKGQGLVGAENGLALAKTENNQAIFAISLETISEELIKLRDKTINLVEAVII